MGVNTFIIIIINNLKLLFSYTILIQTNKQTQNDILMFACL